MTRRDRLNLTDGQIAEFCRRHRIQRMAVFGWILRDDWGPDSDVDVLVEFEAGYSPGLSYFSLGDPS